MVLDKLISSFINYEIQPGFYTFKGLSEALFNILQPEFELYNNSIDIEVDDKTMKTKLVVRTCSIAKKFVEKLFFSTFLGFTPGCDNKQYNENTSQKNVDLSSTKKFN